MRGRILLDMPAAPPSNSAQPLRGRLPAAPAPGRIRGGFPKRTEMKTYSAKPAEVEKKWVLIDAENLVVGRLATIVATMPPRQEQADLHAACRHGRQRRRHQRREGGADRPQARSEALLLAHRLSRRHQGPRRAQGDRGPLPRAHRREGGGAHAAARTARPPAAEEPRGLCRPRASACGAAAGRRSTSPPSPRKNARIS